MSDNMPKVRFSWITHYSCNYRCSYCFYSEGCGWEILKNRNVYLSPEEWIGHWENIYKKYGRCFILITGGEPFTYPNFIELIRELSNIHYPINISTNSSGDLKSFVNQIKPERVSLSVSFHPEFEKLDAFLEKLKFLRSYRFNGCVNFLAYPPFLKNLKCYVDKLDSIGERLKIIPFRGIYQQIAYPWGYSEEEMRLIGMEKAWLDKIRKKGFLCQAGKNSALLLPDGEVSRCGQVWYKFIIGNFFDPDFKLLDEPLPCDAATCPCDEDIVWPEL